jgi:hypothetical protein
MTEEVRSKNGLGKAAPPPYEGRKFDPDERKLIEPPESDD